MRISDVHKQYAYAIYINNSHEQCTYALHEQYGDKVVQNYNHNYTYRLLHDI